MKQVKLFIAVGSDGLAKMNNDVNNFLSMFLSSDIIDIEYETTYSRVDGMIIVVMVTVNNKGVLKNG